MIKQPPVPPKPPECRTIRQCGFIDVPKPPSATKSRVDDPRDSTDSFLLLTSVLAGLIVIATIVVSL